jgi:hypothetical protein
MCVGVHQFEFSNETPWGLSFVFFFALRCQCPHSSLSHLWSVLHTLHFQPPNCINLLADPSKQRRSLRAAAGVHPRGGGFALLSTSPINCHPTAYSRAAMHTSGELIMCAIGTCASCLVWNQLTKPTDTSSPWQQDTSVALLLLLAADPTGAQNSEGTGAS